ncbi:hypothetical protein EsH8_IX_000743 [Colletotrichum jinshuiense]
MPPTPPLTPGNSPIVNQSPKGVPTGYTNGHQRPARERLFTPRPPKVPSRERERDQLSDAASRNFRFRQCVLALLDQQRATIEAWAESVGASGPAEQMDWQPEHERLVYFACLPIEADCYEDRWRIDGGQTIKIAPPRYPELGSWADQS